MTREHKHQSRQDKLKQKQQERQEIEHTRKKTHDEQRNRANERRKLEEEEKILRKKVNKKQIKRRMKKFIFIIGRAFREMYEKVHDTQNTSSRKGPVLQSIHVL